jgi:RNA polymerase sigma-70 factor, ECF subfamily
VPGKDEQFALVQRVLAGEPGSFDELYRLSRRYVVSAVGTIGNPDDREDCIQNAFIQIYRKLHTFNGESLFTTWASTVARNTTLMGLRSGRKHVDNIAGSTDETIDEDGAIKRFEPSVIPREYEFVGDRQKLELCIESLASGYKAVIRLRLQGYEQNEISRELGITIGTVKSQLFKGRRLLSRRMLMSTCKACEEEGRGQIIAHYEADPRRGRPAMCFAHYWKAKGEEPKGVVRPPVVEPERTVVVATVRCSVKACPFPATVDGRCKQHQVVADQHRGAIYEDTRDWREEDPQPTSDVKKPEVAPAAAPAKFEVFDKPKPKDNRAGRLKAFNFRTPNEAEYRYMPGYCLHSQEVLRMTVKRLLAGDTQKDICPDLGVSKSTMYRIQKWLEHPAVKPAADDEDSDETVAEYLSDQEELDRLKKWNDAGMCGQPCNTEIATEPYCNRPIDGHRTHAFDRHIAMPRWYEYRLKMEPLRYRDQVESQETVTMTHQRQTVTETLQVEKTQSEIVFAKPEPVKEELAVPIETNVDLIHEKLSTAMATIHLESGGDIFIMSDVNVFALNRDDRNFYFRLVDLCREYVADHPEVQKARER